MGSSIQAASRGVDAEKKDADADDLQHGDDALLDAVDQHALHRGDVVDDARDDVARGALVVPAQRQALQRAVKIAAQIEDDLLLEGVVEADAQGVEPVLREERRHDDRGRRAAAGRPDAGSRTLSMTRPVTFGKDEAGQRARDGRAERGRGRARIGAGIDPDAAKGFHFINCSGGL